MRKPPKNLRLFVWGTSPEWEEEHVLDVIAVSSLDSAAVILDTAGWEIGVTNMSGETITKVELRVKE